MEDHIIDIFPENIIKSIYEGNVIPIVFFSVICDMALAMLNEEKKKPMLGIVRKFGRNDV